MRNLIIKTSLVLLLFNVQGHCQKLYSTKIKMGNDKIIQQANELLYQQPVPITDFQATRSEGSPNDFYSEGDYWWPDPDNPKGPYIRRDGKTNPDNFTAHRIAMRNLSRWVATLVAAYKISGDKRYAKHAMKHIQAWFLNSNTRMNPHLLYAQAIKGRVSGRGIGIIDTIHLIEIAKSIQVLKDLGYLTSVDLNGLKQWFNQYVTWLTTHPYGIEERDHGNNHSTWWAAQVAAFADLTGRKDIMVIARNQFKKLLTEQMDENGSFPDELSRTKPYNYSLFNLEAFAVLAQIASTPDDDLWNFETPNGSLLTAFEFMVPFIADKSIWIKPPDIQHYEELPIQSTGLLFAAKAYGKDDWFKIWKQLDPEVKSNEIDRTYPIRQPVLWFNQ